MTQLITLDFETYYAPDYSLSKLTTEEYIRGDRFEVIGAAVQVNASTPEWFSGTHDAVARFLNQFDWGNSLMLAHNCMFDGAILGWRFGIHPKGLLDTLSMARPIHGTKVGGSLKALAEYYDLGEKGTEVLNALGKRRLDFAPEELERYGEYCKNDVTLTYELFKRLAQGFPKEELLLIDRTLRMYTCPRLHLDASILEEYKAELAVTKQHLLNECGLTTQELRKDKIFAAALEICGVAVPTKISPTTGKEVYAFAKTDDEFTSLAEHEDARVQALVAARLGAKSTIEETRVERFIGIASRGLFPAPLAYYAALTGRWGGSDKINLQNLRGKSKLKDAMRAPKGYLIVNCDSSQIEARFLAWFAEQDNLVKAFKDKQDVYKMTASAIYGVPVEEITPAQRQIGKVTVLGSGYGLGYKRLQVMLKTVAKVDLPLEECERIINIYRETYPKIPLLWQQGSAVLDAIIADQSVPFGKEGVVTVEGREGIRLPNGMYIRYPNLRKKRKEGGWGHEYAYDMKKGKAVFDKYIYGAGVVENCIQALARIAVGEQLLEVSKRYEVVLTVHDSIVAIVPEKEIETGREFIDACMRKSPLWAPDVPLNCESKIGRSYGQLFDKLEMVV